MRRAGFLLIFLLAGLAGCRDGGAPPPPAEIRAAVERQLAAADMEPARIHRSGPLFRAVALTGRAVPDWLVDFTAVADGRLCGTGGCPLQVWVRDGAAPYRLAFDRRVLAHDVVNPGGGRPWLAVDLHGAVCGATGADACQYRFAWHGGADDPDGYFAPVSIDGRPGRYDGPLVQALPFRPPAGSVVEKAVADYGAACAAAGGEADVGEALARLPDLTGDDRPEWLFDVDSADCRRHDQPLAPHCRGEVCLTRLYTDHGDRRWRTAWTGAAIAYAVDYRQLRPRLLVRPAECAPDCAERALVWREGEGRFTLDAGEAP